MPRRCVATFCDAKIGVGYTSSKIGAKWQRCIEFGRSFISFITIVWLQKTGVHYHEANGRVKPDAIPTATFPRDPGILPLILSETRAESGCNIPLMAS